MIAAHQAGNSNAGINIEEGTVTDAIELGVYDLLLAKQWVLKLAADTAVTILQVDQIIMSKEAGGPKVPNMGSRDA